MRLLDGSMNDHLAGSMNGLLDRWMNGFLDRWSKMDRGIDGRKGSMN